MKALSQNQHIGRGGLFRRFILPQIIIITVAGILGLLWAGNNQREQDSKRLLAVATANAQFVRNQKLPLSPKLASYLTSLTGFKIAFLQPSGTIIHGSSWSDTELALAKRSIDSPGISITQNNREAVSSPSPVRRTFIVATQPQKPLIAWSGSRNFYPLLGGVLLAVASAFMIARSIVRPLSQLANTPFLASPDDPATLPESLTKRHDEIGILSNTLLDQHQSLLQEQKRRRESEKMALLGTLTTSLAHEIKNPASAIIMHARDLETQHHLPQGSLIRSEGEEIVSLVNQWLFVAKPQPPQTKPTDLSLLLSQLKEKIHPILTFQQSELSLDLPDSLLVDCDSQRIEQVFRNLIDNALYAMPTGGGSPSPSANAMITPV